MFTLAKVLAEADKNGCRAETDEFLRLAGSFSLHSKAKKHSIMITPPQNENVFLFTLWPGTVKDCLGNLYIEVAVWTLKAGKSWDKYLGIKSAELINSLVPVFEYYEYSYGDSEYTVLRKCIDSSNLRQAIEKLEKILSRGGQES